MSTNDPTTDAGRETRVRYARPAEMAVLSRRFQAAMRDPTRARFLVAEDGSDVFAGVSCFIGQRSPKGRRLDCHLAFRDEGAVVESGPALFRALRVEARNAGANLISCATPVPEESPLRGVLTEAGFQAEDTLTSYEMDIVPEHARLVRFVARLRSRDRLPADADILPLSSADLTAALVLVRNGIGSDSFMLRKMDEAGEFSDRFSRVAQVGAAIEGVLIVCESGPCPTVSFMAIEGRSRGSWVFPALTAEAFGALIEAGHDRICFKTNPSIDVTVTNYARRTGCRVLGAEQFYRLRFVVDGGGRLLAGCRSGSSGGILPPE